MSLERSTYQDLLASDRLEGEFTDFKPAYRAPEALAEANRCLGCFEAPCMAACPTHIDVPRFIARIAQEQPVQSARTIVESNVLGLSCAQSCPTEVLCEGACVYHRLGQKPVGIGRLQRFAMEQAYERGQALSEPGAPTGRRVALVGAGPASLACAHELRRRGHEAVIFEKARLPGGLNTTGIAPYKMKSSVSLREIQEIERMGVRIEHGRELGRDLELDALAKDFDAVFLGLGLGPDARLAIPGKDLPGVYGAVELIAALKTRPAAELAAIRAARAAVVIGGGNTALDSCRELRMLGVPSVRVAYRRGEAEMSGYAHEYRCARQEGVEFLFHAQPVAIEGSRPLRLALRTASGESFHAEADLIVFATGQSKLETLLAGKAGLLFRSGCLVVDPATGRTSNPRIFAGGNLANGGKEVVNAVAEGKRAAEAIHAELSGSRS